MMQIEIDYRVYSPGSQCIAAKDLRVRFRFSFHGRSRNIVFRLSTWSPSFTTASATFPVGRTRLGYVHFPET